MYNVLNDRNTRSSTDFSQKYIEWKTRRNRDRACQYLFL